MIQVTYGISTHYSVTLLRETATTRPAQGEAGLPEIDDDKGLNPV
jgi:hypothetical protein